MSLMLRLAFACCALRVAASAALSLTATGDVAPVVVSTWFAPAVQAAYGVLAARLPAIEAVDAGCTYCEVNQCDTTVGFGHHPDTAGRVTLDALVMDGATFNAGAVGDLRGVRGAFAAARGVMAHSAHTLLAGAGAADFAAGLLGQAANGADHLNDAFRGKARDDAFVAAVEEAKRQFHHCSRCGKWVCPESCWNAARQLCEECAPDLAEETAAVQAQVAREQLYEKARQTHLVKGVDMSREAAAHCPSCGARAGAAKFCPECGQALNPKVACPACDAEMEARAKFCPECGHKR
jgi:hypothetical protein